MSETVRCWLVERDYYDEDLVTLVYATPNGQRHLTQQLSTALLMKSPPTAAKDVESDRLEPVTDDGTRRRYATEAERMIDRHDPDDHV
ncbi:hypothetical protein [Halapricum hydrolyticum]|uniref:DUF7967 domain-containing protein n=1 Tax=Halapricum hydrolyticum TaxID=2979991 RepID=A0AAE3LIT2_9EURY|nr:hypothetical protein [Halapricum hydrolyticum]MCU4717469.1 hypothetical protein [Halapricum hydrolyticum]MCU4726633.1 hypothetical protein [Halapricum hydrolyticum]